MIEKLVESIIKRKILIFIILAAAVIGGISCYHIMPRTSFPKVDIPLASVTVVYPGATAEEVEQEITKKVENICQGVTDVDEYTSQSMANACAVTLTFDKKIPQDELEMDFIELRRKMQILKSELPSGVSAINVNTDTMETASLVMAVTGDETVSNDLLAQRAEDLGDKLKLIDGVSKIKTSGSNDSEISVTVSSEKLNKLNLSLYEICTIIDANNSMIPIGDMTVNDSEITVKTSARYDSVDDIGNIILTATDDNTLIRLKDVADIEIKEPDDVSYYLYNDKKSIVVSLYFKENLNVVSKANEVKAAISEYENELPDSITVNEVYFQSDDVKDDINNFIVSLIEAIAVVMLVIMLGMNRRNAAIVSIAIPVIIFITFIMMKVFDVQIHFVSLAALIMVLGMLVDNSIVVSDSIQTCLDEGMDRMEACKKGVSKVLLSVFLSMLTTVIVFASMFTLTGTYKQLASSIPSIAVISMITSFFVSVFVTPVFSYLFLLPADKRNKNKKRSNKEGLSVRLYRRLFKTAFTHKKTSVALVLVVIAICGCISAASPMQLLPKTNKNYVLINITNETQNDLTGTGKIVRAAREIVMEQPETVLTLSGVGICVPRYNFSVIDRGEMDANGDICARIDLKKGGRFKKTYELVNYIQDEVDKRITGADAVVTELGIIPSRDPEVSIYVKGNDLDEINTVSEQAAELLKSIDGVKAVSNDRHYSTYGYYVDIDDKKRNSLALTNREIQNELNIAVSGRDASVFYRNGKEYNINVKSDLSSTDDLSNYSVKASSGEKYMVKQFADIGLDPAANTITRVNGERGAMVGGYVKNGYGSSSVQTKFEKMLESDLEIPDGMSIEYKGDKNLGAEAITSICIAACMSFLVIFLILYMQYGRFRQVFLLFSSVPLGAAVGVAALRTGGIELSFFALLGLLSMLGIVLANAIVLVDFINTERENGAAVDDACRIAGEKRLTPILMSTMTTVFGFLPLALSGQTLFLGMSVLLMAALTVCMIFNLVMVPTIYSMIEKEDNEDGVEKKYRRARRAVYSRAASKRRARRESNAEQRDEIDCGADVGDGE